MAVLGWGGRLAGGRAARASEEARGGANSTNGAEQADCSARHRRGDREAPREAHALGVISEVATPGMESQRQVALIDVAVIDAM